MIIFKYSSVSVTLKFRHFLVKIIIKQKHMEECVHEYRCHPLPAKVNSGIIQERKK